MEVRHRLNDVRASHDLHAADARYHEDCRKKFCNKRNVSSAAVGEKEEIVDQCFNSLMETMLKDKSRMWTSIELESEYRNTGGTILTRRKLIKKISHFLKDEAMVLSSPGIASIVVFKNKANSMLRIQEVEKETENDTSDEVLDMIAKSIVSEIKEIPSDKSNYQSRINISLAKSDVSPTLAKLLSKIDSKALHPESLPAIYMSET